MARRAHDLPAIGWLEDAYRDARYALRAFGKTPGFSSVAIGTMALAIGAATALFSVIDVALLRPLPYPNPEQVVWITVGEGSERRSSPSLSDIESWRSDTAVFAKVGIGRSRFSATPPIVDAATPERVIVGMASEDFLEVFGITPILGRSFTIDDRRPGAPRVVLISHAFWHTRFSGSLDVLGRLMRVDGEPATIVGVLPPGFYAETMVWQPYVFAAPVFAGRGSGMPVYGRLRPGLDLLSAERELTTRLSAVDGNPDARVWLVSLYDDTTRGYGRTVAILSGAVVLIVLIGCVNVAGLLLARGTTREPELAIRKSIGATRGRLVRQLLAESAVLALIAGLGGIVLAWATLDVIVGLVPLRMPDNVSPAVNLTVLGFALALAIVTAFGFGLAPAVKTSGAKARTFVAAARMRHGSALTRRGGQVLIAAEVALALVLVTGAALMLRSFSKILAIDVGFEPGAIHTMEIVPMERNSGKLRNYYVDLLRRVREVPGVAAAGGAERPPLDSSSFYLNAVADGRTTYVGMRLVTSGYFEAAGHRLVQGRFPTDAEYMATPSFAVLSESAAQQMFPNQSSIGQQITLTGGSQWAVVGVVTDARNRSPLIYGDRPDVYVGYHPDESSGGMTLVVRPSFPIPRLAQQLREIAHATGPSVFTGPVRSGRDWFVDNVAIPRQRTLMLSALGGLGLMLTLVGIFATTAYAVARRTHEVGVRMALGARPGQMVLAIVRDTAWPVALGIALGLGGAVAATRVIASFLFETTPTDPVTLAITVVALAITALLAAWIPARRAARVDPVAALRAE